MYRLLKGISCSPSGDAFSGDDNESGDHGVMDVPESRNKDNGSRVRAGRNTGNIK